MLHISRSSVAFFVVMAAGLPAWTQAPAAPKKAAHPKTAPARAKTPAGEAAPATPETAKPASDKPTSAKMSPRGVQRGAFTAEDKNTFEAERRIAILVAPSYRDSGLATLKYNFNDAVELRTELERQGYTVRVISNSDATSDAIRESLERQKTYLDGTTQATLLFAFMGHGFQDKETKQNYLMTAGATVDNMTKEALSVTKIEQLMNETPARRKIVLIDACRNEPGTRDASAARTMAEFKAAEGMAIILATKPGQFSYEAEELRHGVFTNFLLEGLRGKAAGKDGFISFHDLSGYVEKSVLTYSEKKDQAQKPLSTLEDVGGDFLLATAAPAKPEEIKTNPLASQITSDVPIMRAVGAKLSYFALLGDATMTLVDTTSGVPVAMLNEQPDQMKDAAVVKQRSLRWFGGNVGADIVMNLVAEMHGSDIVEIYGRTGKACPNNTVCNATPYPLLPGETRDKKAAAVEKTKKGAFAAMQGLSSVMNARTGKVMSTIGNSAQAAQGSGMLDSDRSRFIWNAFTLTSSATPSAAPTKTTTATAKDTPPAIQ